MLDEYNIPGSKRSFIRAISKAQAWCKANGTYIDLSKYLGAGAEVYTTGPTGTFHLTYVYRQRKHRRGEVTERRLTVFLHGRDLYIRGWRSKNGTFEIQKKESQTYNYIPDPSCRRVKIGENYYDYRARGDIRRVRIGLPCMMSYFNDLEKCDGIVSDEALKAIAGFIVNGPEPIRLSEVEEEIVESYDNFEIVYLDSREKKLDLQIKKYKHYSAEKLKCVTAIVLEETMPDIINSGGLKISSHEKLLSMVTVPLRDSFRSKVFKHEKRPDADSWCPPCLESLKEDEHWLGEDKKLEQEHGADGQCSEPVHSQ